MVKLFPQVNATWFTCVEVYYSAETVYSIVFNDRIQEDEPKVIKFYLTPAFTKMNLVVRKVLES